MRVSKTLQLLLLHRLLARQRAGPLPISPAASGWNHAGDGEPGCRYNTGQLRLWCRALTGQGGPTLRLGRCGPHHLAVLHSHCADCMAAPCV